jgi:D-alanyl-D-alanine carboxypeptidase
MTSLILAFAVVLAVGFTSVPTEAAARGASLVVDAGTGRTLQATHADTPHKPASLTKMMTLYLLFDQLERGKMTMSTRMRVSKRAASMPPTKLGLPPGSRITVREAILALVTKSANDVAVVVAEAISGSETAFAQRMTRKARALGMRRTTFGNASGLPNSRQKTTARDMATLARALLRDHPRFYPMFSTRVFVHRTGRHRNHNGLLFTYRGVDGLKTGFTHAAGYNLVASAKRGPTRLIGVVLGAPTSAVRARKMTTLLDDGFRKASATRVVTAKSTVKKSSVTKSRSHASRSVRTAKRGSKVASSRRSRSKVVVTAAPPRPKSKAAPSQSRQEVMLSPPSSRPRRAATGPSG